MHESATSIRTDLLEVIPYTYISITNILLAGLWVAVIIAIFAAMRKIRTAMRYKTN
jgi:flagellar biosynthesis protein FliQ